MCAACCRASGDGSRTIPQPTSRDERPSAPLAEVSVAEVSVAEVSVAEVSVAEVSA